MGRKAKTVDKEGLFQERLREQYLKHCRSQNELADMLDMSRQAVAGWLNGKSIPDIHALEKMARLFGVSADYLLGLSDTASPEVSVRAAVQYTGLSEAAVKWLHIGLDDFECDGVGLSEKEKKENLHIASALIQSKYFTKIIHNLVEVEKEAYIEKILTILEGQHSDCDLSEDGDSHYANKGDRDIVVENLRHIIEFQQTTLDDSTAEELRAMDDEELAGIVIQALLRHREKNELHQFHAAKAFTGYIDRLVKVSQKKAERRFAPK